MAKNIYGNNDRGRKSAHEFDKLVSPLGEDCSQTPTYSPATTVNGAKMQKGKSGKSEYSRNERRGG